MTTRDDKYFNDTNNIHSKIKCIGNPNRASAKGKRRKGKAKHRNKLREIKNIEMSPEKSPEFKTPEIRKQDKHFRIVHKASTIKSTKWIGTTENKTKREIEEDTKFSDGSYLRTPINKSKNNSVSKDAIVLPVGYQNQNCRGLELNYNPYSNIMQKINSSEELFWRGYNISVNWIE